MAYTRTVGSLPVANVQALAEACNRSDGRQIPVRYIRTEVSSEEVVGSQGNTAVIPTIDLNKLLDPQSSEEECAKLGSACRDWGFFQLINHGVPDEVISNLRNDMIEFFNQPLEAKKAYSQVPNSIEGYGQAFVVSEYQELDWADMFYLIVRPSESRDTRFWPSHPPSFRQSIDRYSTETAKVARCLLEFMAKDMGVAPEVLLEKFQGQPQSLRVNYYPPCLQADKVLGLSPHTDGTALTLLLQANDVQGLQIRRDGKWLPVDTIDGALIANIGDILEILSNGMYRSIEHRAVVDPHRYRLSAAMFHQPGKNTMVGPLPDLVKNGEARYESMSHLDFIKHIFSGKLDGRGHLEKIRNFKYEPQETCE